VRGRDSGPARAPDVSTDPMPFDTQDDGFGDMDFRRPEPSPEPSPETRPETAPGGDAPDGPGAGPGAAEDAALAAIAAEGLTGRQLRRARLLAQQHGIAAQSDLDAILQLRQRGINPFARAALLEVVSPSDPRPSPPEAPPQDAAPPQGRALARLPGDQVQLPQRAKPIKLPTPDQRAEVNQAAEILRMQQDIARRRRRKLALLFARLFVFVMLPTIFAGWYFYRVATPIYSAKTEFLIQQASPQSGGGGGLGGLLAGTGHATAQDSIAVQGFLQSREAMLRLEEDLGFRAHFQREDIDPLQRLEPEATLEATFDVYRDFVSVSYDPSEGLIRMEVMATDPATATAWAEQLVRYAEQQVDQLTQRLRAEQMQEAQARYEEAQTKLSDSQRRLIELQEKFNVISSETEVGLVTSQIATLEGQLTQDRLALAQMERNPNPNPARVEPLRDRIAAMEAEIAAMRSRLTVGEMGAASMAEVQSQLMVAQSDLQTRQMILTQALQSMETARVEANRQVRYLSVSVHPVSPDEPAYPRAFENTLVTMLILLAIYLMVSMTAAILREQLSA